jgi:hypothetical protein
MNKSIPKNEKMKNPPNFFLEGFWRVWRVFGGFLR